MELKFNIILVITVLVAGVSCVADEFPSSIERCKVEDEDCITNSFNKYLPVAEKNGIPELDIPISDKHFVAKQEISIGSSVLTLNIAMHNMTGIGLASGTVAKVTGFKKEAKDTKFIEISGLVPYMKLSGTYIGSGKLLLLQVTGTGPGEIEFFNTTYRIRVFFKVETRDGEEYIIPTKGRNEYHSERNHFKFDNILNNKEISDGINTVVNENHELFAKEMNKSVGAAFSGIFIELLTPIFKKYPYRMFFVD